jgi:hypothetical protein
MTTCQTSLLGPLLVSLLAKSQELPVSQLVRHVDLFHLVITDNQRPFQPNCCSLISGSGGRGMDSPAVCNKSFFSTCGMVFIQQFLTVPWSPEFWLKMVHISTLFYFLFGLDMLSPIELYAYQDLAEISKLFMPVVLLTTIMQLNLMLCKLMKCD